MTTRIRTHPQAKPVEVRLLIPADVYEDLKAVSKVSGLAVSQYARSLILRHVAKIYASAETKDSTP
ncbi:hypothetical protein ABS771_08495 [Methylobacterium brachiatum]|uniref:Ribbon-helix-helix protein, CopG family n=1 Tax=Methylobacterium brachiatum TaxID=269660 RepID=A0ABV1QVT9_9HYPH